MQSIIILALSIVAGSAIIYCILLKRDIKNLETTLGKISESDTNMMLTTKTFDGDIRKLCIKTNEMLKGQREIVRKNEETMLEMRRTITNVSHDLRTPLTSIVGYLQMAESEKTSMEKKKEYFKIINLRLKALTDLMEELFEFTKIVEGQTEYNADKVNVCNVTMDTVIAFYDSFVEKGITPEIDIPKNAVYAYCDAGMLSRIVQNLTKNAIQHGGNSFSVSIDPDKPLIKFSNDLKNPQEINPELLFERFYTTEPSRTSKNTGLGLAIVKELVERMQGRQGRIGAKVENETLVISMEFQKM